MPNNFNAVLLGVFLISYISCSNTRLDEEICKGPNEIFSYCGTACQPNCENYMLDLPCDKPCVSGCFCKMGYIRNSKFRCVMPEHCDLLIEPSYDCPQPNERFSTCGTECPLTCENYMKENTCTKKCVSGCFCEPGYVRDSIGFCVLPKDCPPAGISLPPNPTCKNPNETYSSCGTLCPETCATYMKPPECKKKCAAGCFCIEGYVRNYENKCVKYSDCPKEAPLRPGQFPKCKSKWEEYLTCGTACPRTCHNLNRTIACPMKCKEGCFCRPGLVRDKYGSCIHPYYCSRPHKVNCKYLEQQATVSRPCSGTCEDPYNCYPGTLDQCVCKRGMVQDNIGQCVHQDFCPLGCFEANEIFDCGSPCDRDCRKIGEPCDVFSYQCVFKCYCKEGYARDHRGKCIQLKYCPRKSSIMQLFYEPQKFIYE